MKKLLLISALMVSGVSFSAQKSDVSIQAEAENAGIMASGGNH